MATYILSIPTMKCDGCTSTVDSTLKALSNVDSVTVNLETKQATVEGDVEINALITAVTDAGFPATAV